MQTTTQEIIYQVLMILVSVSIVGVAGYVRKYINTKVKLEEYGLSKEKLNTLLNEAVLFAEQKGKEYAKANSTYLSGSRKLDFARSYVNNIDKNIIKEYGEKLDDMISVKVAETFGTSLKR